MNYIRRCAQAFWQLSVCFAWRCQGRYSWDQASLASITARPNCTLNDSTELLFAGLTVGLAYVHSLSLPLTKRLSPPSWLHGVAVRQSAYSRYYQYSCRFKPLLSFI
ncbi:hypothetical protein EV401DRAFT_1948379 [Pisolithus croceorrhizus]|nr:hypothetical protein EV401DRAFT_1948379 [Pisolithus croceorrhizus]